MPSVTGASGRPATTMIGERARIAVSAVVIIAAFFFLGRELISGWERLEQEQLGFEPVRFVAATALMASGIAVLGVAWFTVVARLAPKADLRGTRFLRIFLLAWIGRYVPGKVAFWAGKIYLARREGPAMGTLLVGTAYENLLYVAVILALSTGTILPTLALRSEGLVPFAPLVPLMLAAVIGLHPHHVRRLLGVALRLMGRKEERLDSLVLPAGGVVAAGGTYLLATVLMGLGFFLFADALTDLPVRYLPYIIGSFNLAVLIGMAAFVIPSGIGVREGALVGLLQYVMPVEVAVAVSLASRLWTIAVDGALFGVAAAWDRLLADQVGWPAAAGREIETASKVEE